MVIRKSIKVIANAGADEIIEAEGVVTVKVREPPEKNRANIAVMKLLSKHYGKKVRIVSGFGSRRKVVEVPD